MKAVVYEKYGLPDVLELKEIEAPVPEDDQVLIKVHAVSINDWDWNLLLGKPFINRILFGLFKPKKKILGSDVAGIIEAVGKNVQKFHIGDEVYGDLSGQWGGFAEYVCAHESALATKPAIMTFAEAASIPQAAMLAIQGLIDEGQIRQGQKVLINGGGGGVGTFGVQIAKLYGAEVTGVDSTAKLETMRSIGFDHVIDYTQEDCTKSGQCYGLILDVKTNRSIGDYMRVLNPDGTFVTVGGSMFRLLQALLLWPFISIRTKKKIRIVKLKANKDLVYMNKLFEQGRVKPVIDRQFKLSEIRQAMQYFGGAKHKGKVVITLE